MSFRNVVLASVILAAILIGCSNAGDKPAVKSTDTLGVRDITNRSTCVGSVPPAGGVIGAWTMAQARFDADTLKSEQLETLTINANSTTLRMHCFDLAGKSTDATVTVPSAVFGNTLSILQSQSSHSSFQDGDLLVNCDAAVQKGDLYFSFQGPCLSINSAGTTLVMVPQ